MEQGGRWAGANATKKGKCENSEASLLHTMEVTAAGVNQVEHVGPEEKGNKCVNV